MFETDEDPGTPYPMRYDAVKKYADKKHTSYSMFVLPKQLRKVNKRKIDIAVTATKKKKEDGESASKVSPGTKKKTKEEASKLLKIISGDGVDIIADLKSRLEKGDPATVEFLKSIYPADEVNQCLLCGENCVPGISKECTVHHDIPDFEFEHDVWCNSNGCYLGTWMGSCSRCDEQIQVSGTDNDGPPCAADFGFCYRGKHVFTEEKKEELLRTMNPDNY